MKLFRSIVTVALIVLSGCAYAPLQKPTETGPVKNTPAPLPAPAHDPALVDGDTWSLTLEMPHMWKKVDPIDEPEEGATLALLMESKDDVGSLPINLQLVTGQNPTPTDDTFIMHVLQNQSEQDHIKMLKVKKVQLASGEIAAYALQVRKVDVGLVGVLEVVAAKDGQGYVLTCAGEMQAIETWGPVCQETLSTFRLKPRLSKKQHFDAKSTNTSL